MKLALIFTLSVFHIASCSMNMKGFTAFNVGRSVELSIRSYCNSSGIQLTSFSLTIGDLSSPGDEGGLSLNLTTYLLRIRGSLHLCPCDSDNSSHVEVYSEVVQKKLHCVIATKWETMIAGWLRRKCHCENIVSVTAKFWLHRLIL